MYIYLSNNLIFAFIFLLGMLTGVIVYRILTAPMDKADREHLKELSDLISNFQYPKEPMPSLKKPKK